MNTKKIPAITSLLGVLVTLIIVGIKRFDFTIDRILTTLFLVLLSFYIIGIIIKIIVDKSIAKMQSQNKEADLQTEQISQEAKTDENPVDE